MSFVGIHITNEGLIAFGDSKATIKYKDGRTKEDTKRGQICKVFKNNKFIFVTFGNNELFSTKHKQNIEDYISSNLTNNMSYQEFFSIMQKRINEDEADYNDNTYKFIIGAKDNDKYYICTCTITPESFLLSNPTYSGCIVGGDELYQKIFLAHTFYDDVPIVVYKEKIKQMIESIITMENVLNDYKYNSVGFPVRVEIFQ